MQEKGGYNDGKMTAHLGVRSDQHREQVKSDDHAQQTLTTGDHAIG